MNLHTETLLDSMLRRSPVQSFFHWKASGRLAVLAYHGVDDAERFGRHLDQLRRTAHPLSLDELLDSFEGRRHLPQRAVLITFDDGHRSVLDVALPMLRERGLPAVAFVVAGIVGSDRPFWWTEVIDLATHGGVVDGMASLSPHDLVRSLKRVPDERRRAAIVELRSTAARAASPMPQLTAKDLRTLETGGIMVGNHTWSHPCLPRCQDGTKRHEIEDAHRTLTRILGHAPGAFAYPDGGRDHVSAAILDELGYRAGFLFDHHLSPMRPPDRLAVSRLRVNSTTTLDRFQMIASGFHPTLHRVRGGA